MSEVSWKQEYGCQLGSLSHRPSPLGGHLIRFDFHQLEVEGSFDFVRPEMRGPLALSRAFNQLRGLYEESHQQWDLVELLGPGDALVRQTNSGCHGEDGTRRKSLAGACCDSGWCSSAGMLVPAPLGA